MKFFTKLVALLLVSAPLWAQNTNRGLVSGSVLDEKNVPFPFVNVLLLKAKDSTLAKGMTSDADGKFAFESIEAGRYLTLVSMVGYQKVYSPVFTVANSEVKLSPVKLTTSVELLDEVRVVAQKPFIEQQIDRTVVNVENSIVSAGATALEVLERAPGVVVDQQNDALKLRGKDGVLVQIDGKRSFLSQTELMNLLRNTPSDNIEKIELITNPSAKYDAAGNSGIINIVFKKNKNYGTNGNFTVGGGYMPDGSVGRGNASLALNHRQGKINIFGNGSVYSGGHVNTNDIYRTIPFEGEVTIFDQNNKRRSNYQNYSIRTGMDYSLTDKTTLGVLASAFFNDWSQPEGINNSRILDGDFNLIRSFLTQSTNGQKTNNVTTNLNVKHKFDDKGKELTFDADYVHYGGQSFNNLNTTYFKPDGTLDGSPDLVRNDMPSTINIGVVKLDYVQKLGKGKFETGLKSSYVKSDNDLTFEVKQDVWVIDPTRTNRFKYTENINAVYVNYGGKLSEKTTYQLGFRAEHTHSIGNSVTLNDVRDRNYLNLFPSVFLSQQLDSSNVLNFSYSRRIDRPDYQSLNPFEFYLDPYTFERGNPNLRPQYTHALQVTHVYKSFINTSISYSRINDLIAREVPRQIPSENKTFVTTENLDTQDNVNLTVSLPIPIAKWWTLQANLTGSYNRYKTFYGDALYDVNQLNYNIYASNQFKMKNNWSAELSGWYNSPSVYGFFVSNPQGMINLGLQKSVWEKKGTFRLNVSDIFWMNKFSGRAQFQDIDLRVRSTWPSRQIRLTFTYNFGNQNVKGARQRNTGADDLQQRVKSN
ncbi:outer membrane beta-barrel family protein [Persicitalea jodogahamensis]|uniref:TonB-dependent receptor n=1 Tax=Persicitalea jodogahamensis TaxID=402147 RepID=A0A8J3DDG3_9BACT|nr:outer membrane beta-barrel family protein [Persicitalea jodogahamensis]GHB80341.1 TonB-dependent receptor [Persicitalea jodogahamensis]